MRPRKAIVKNERTTISPIQNTIANGKADSIISLKISKATFILNAPSHSILDYIASFLHKYHKLNTMPDNETIYSDDPQQQLTFHFLHDFQNHQYVY